MKVDTPEVSIQEILTKKEREIWEHAKNKNFSAIGSMFADNYLCIGYAPDGGIWRVGKSELGKVDTLEIIDYALDDFKIIMADDHVAILTYKAKGTFAGGQFSIFATTVWANYEGTWLAIFYQGTSERGL